MPSRVREEAPSFDLTAPTEEEFAGLVRACSEEERHLLLDHGEEPSFGGALLAERRPGLYLCRLCGLPLFRSDCKYESGTGWPSFRESSFKGHLRELRDTSFGMVRTEVACARCGAHIGHVFPDGPAPTGLRYCVNSACLLFVPAADPLPDRLARGSPEGDVWKY